MDWEKGADDNSYSQSAANTRVVGAMTGELIKALHNTEQAPYNSMHLIGHSLGAQSVGYAGERVSGIGRITGTLWTYIAMQFSSKSSRLLITRQ